MSGKNCLVLQAESLASSPTATDKGQKQPEFDEDSSAFVPLSAHPSTHRENPTGTVSTGYAIRKTQVWIPATSFKAWAKYLTTLNFSSLVKRFLSCHTRIPKACLRDWMRPCVPSLSSEAGTPQVPNPCRPKEEGSHLHHVPASTPTGNFLLALSVLRGTSVSPWC